MGAPRAPIFHPAPAADLLDGGAVVNLAFYAGSPRPVGVDLRHPRSVGARGEHDRLVSVEGVEGSPHRDVLVGDDRANVLIAYPRYLAGRGRHGTGGDRLTGNGGDDSLQPESAPDVTAYGRGNDTVRLGASAPRPPVVGPACESLDVSGGAGCDVYSHLRFASGQITATFARRARPCHPDEVTATLADGTEVGQTTHGISNPRLAIPLSPAGRDAATRNRPLFLRFTSASAAVGIRLR